MNFVPNIVSGVVVLGTLACVTILGVFGVLNGEAITGLLSAIVGGGLVHAARPGVARQVNLTVPSDTASNIVGN